MKSASSITRHVVAACGLAAAGLAQSTVAGTIVINARNSTQTVSFTDTSAFSDAATAGSSVYAISGNPGDTYSTGYTTTHGSTGFTVTTSSGFSASAPVFTSGIPNDTYSFAVTETAATAMTGTFTVSDNLAVNVAPSGGLTDLTTGNNGAFNYLDGIYNPTGNQTSGDPFTYTLYLPGNYSTSGVGTGDHLLISINPAWTIGQNFVFNGTDTVFSASINDYNPNTDRIGLEYQIYGSAVPLPAAAWLLLSGLGGLGALARKRQTA